MIERKLLIMLRNGPTVGIRDIMILRKLVVIVLILLLSVYMLEAGRCIMIS